MVRERRQRKQGSWRSKHRNDVSRWFLNVVEQAERKRRRERRPCMYDSVEECMNAERPTRKSAAHRPKPG